MGHYRAGLSNVIRLHRLSRRSRVPDTSPGSTRLCADTDLIIAALCSNSHSNKVSPGDVRRYAPADGSSTVAKIAADLRPSADGSAVRTSLVAGGG